MATKINKVFLNPTAEQIAEYKLEQGVTWFTEIDAIAAVLEEDREKKPTERKYSLNNFQIVDGGRQITANLTKIAKETGYTLSNDLLKVIDWAKTEIDYDADSTVDHRVASTAADGKAELSNQARVNEPTTEIKRYQPLHVPPFDATAAGQEAYDAAVEAQVKAYDDANAPADTKIIGYKDLTLTNIGSKATYEEDDAPFAERKTVVTQYATTDVKGGDFSFDYQEDSTKAIDKKDTFLLTESGKENAKISAAASGTLSVKDSVLNDIGSSFTESAGSIKALHTNDEASALVDRTIEDAGGYETVVIDNTVVGGTIKGGSISIEKTSTFTKETFLDKEAESGKYYNSVKAAEVDAAASNNSKLYIFVSDETPALTADEVTKLQEKGYDVTGGADQNNLIVNKYEVLTFDVNGDAIRTGSYVYLTTAEFNNLSDGHRNALNKVGDDVGYVDYSPERVVTDANYLEYNQAPAGAAAGANAVNKYVFKNGAEQTVTYYLTAAELGNKLDDESIYYQIDHVDGYTTKVVEESVEDMSFRRALDAATVSNFRTDAKAGYHTISDTYKQYTISATITAEAALELNKVDMANGFAWVGAGTSNEKKLFCMSHFKNEGGKSVETKYYLTASEMAAMGFFDDANIDTFKEVRDADADHLTKAGWAFTGNEVGAARVYNNAEDDPMYRNGVAATEATLSNYTIDKTAAVTAEASNSYQKVQIGYTTVGNAVNKYTFTDGLVEVTYYLTAEELGDGTAGTIKKAIYDAGYNTPVPGPGKTVENGGFLRVAPVGTVDADNYDTQAIAAYTNLKGATAQIDGQFQELVDNNLVGKDAQFVTVIDGEVVDMYQPYGYAATVTDLATAVPGKLSTNAAEIKYSAAIQEALWDGDDKIEEKHATLVNGIRTQNTKKYFDQYADEDGEYVAATPAEEELGEKKHEFIVVAEQRKRGTNKTIDYDVDKGELVTTVQAKIDDGTGKFVAAYYDRMGDLTDKSQDETKNDLVSYYRDGTDPTIIYALTDAEVGVPAIAALLDGGVATKLYYYTVENDNGWFANDDDAKALGPNPVKVTQPKYRDETVGAVTAGTIAKAAYSTLVQAGNLTDELYTSFEKAYVTEEIYFSEDGGLGEGNTARIQVDGKDAFYERVSGALVTSQSTTYDAIFAYQLKSGGTSVDNLTYYMTEAEADKAAIPAGYAANTEWVKGAQQANGGGNYLYRISKTGTDKNAYLSLDEKETWVGDGTPHDSVTLDDNAPAYNHIKYVIGQQAYKYTVEGESTVYYLTEDEAGIIADTWGGALVRGEKAEGSVHYGQAESYTAINKEKFTKSGTVFYFSDKYNGEIPGEAGMIWTITQDAEGNAFQAFNADGEKIWSNIGLQAWNEGLSKYSTVASEMCDNTYFYNYNDPKKWSAEQVLKISTAEQAAGIATWKVEDVNGQIVWTRTTPMGEVSTYIMDYEGVVTAENTKGNVSTEATGKISIINGSEVRGTISGYKDVIVTDSKVAAVEGGNTSDISATTLSTSKGSVGKDGTQTITTKETENTAVAQSAAGSFTITRSSNDKIYEDAGAVTGYETVVISGVTAGDLKAADSIEGSNYTKTVVGNTQTSYQGDPDALRSNYIDNWKDLAFTKGIVTKVTADSQNTKEAYASVGTLTAAGRDYQYVPGSGQDKANTLGNIAGYKQVTLTNIGAGTITAIDRTADEQTTYKLSTKNNVDTATETLKSKTDKKAVAELTAVNTVTNPEVEADLKLGNIEGFATVTTVNYSFDDANALGEVSTSRTKSSARDAVASNMRLFNAGVQDDGSIDTGDSIKKYSYDGEPQAAAEGVSYKKNGTSYSDSTTTKRTANGTLTATGRAYEEEDANTVNHTDSQLDVEKDPVYAYTQTASGRTYYLTETQFEDILSGSKADAAQWTKGSEVVYYRNTEDAVTTYDGTVTGAQVVYKYKDDGDDIRYLTEGEAASYNLVHDAHKMVKQEGPASLRKNNDAKVVFGSNIESIHSTTVAGGANVGTVIVKEYSKDGEANQFLTEAEATAGGWTKVDDDEFVRKANAGDHRDGGSCIAIGDMVSTNMKVYVNKYDSSDYFVVDSTAANNEEAFLLDVAADFMENYALSDLKGYRLDDAGVNAHMSAVKGGVSAASGWTFVETHSYVKVNAFDEVTNQAYVTDADFALMSKTGKDLDGYIKDDGSHKNAPDTALTKYQVREASLVVTEDTTYATITANSQDVDKAELIGLKLTDEQAADAELYTVGAYTGKRSEFVLAPVTEDPVKGNTTFRNIYGYKTVSLTGMEVADGATGNIYRVAKDGEVAPDNDTTSKTYKKTSKKGKDGAVTYTENDTRKETLTYTVDGSVELVDSTVGNIAGYKTITAKPVSGTVEVGLISRTTNDAEAKADGSLDKFTRDKKTKIVTEDSAATFKISKSQQDKTTETRTAAGSVELVGTRAGKELVIDKSILYTSPDEADDAAQAAIDAYDNQQYANVKITGGVVGYQDVTVTNASITEADVVFAGGKNTKTTSEDHTTLTIKDNDGEFFTVMNKINDSTSTTKTAAGSLTMTNVNYAGAYTKGHGDAAAEGYTEVNEYVFNGKTYALTAEEQAALPEVKYVDLKQKSSAPTYYVDVLREDASITTPAIELTGTMQDVVKAKGVKTAGGGLPDYAQNTVYFAAKAKNGAGNVVDIYIRADQVNDLLEGTVVDLEDAMKFYTEAVVDTSVTYYGAHANVAYLKPAFDAGEKLAANVKKYVVTANGKSTTYYLTDDEAKVMKDIAGMDVAAGSDTKAYTRMTSSGDAVSFADYAEAAADKFKDAKAIGEVVTVYEYRGVKKDTGMSVSYFLQDSEVEAGWLDDAEVFGSFGKVGTQTYKRFGVVTSGDFWITATEASVYNTEVKKYANGGLNPIYLTDKEAVLYKTFNDTYAPYEKVDDTVYYRKAANAFDVAVTADLNDKFTSVNESVEVFEVRNAEDVTLGYLTRAEILALKNAFEAAGSDFYEIYKVYDNAPEGYAGPTYLRAADDTTEIVKINALEGGYVVEGADLPDALYYAKVTSAAPAAVDRADATGFQTVTLTNADMRDITGGKYTQKTTAKLTAKKTSSIATYTTTADESFTAVGSLTATDSAIRDIAWYDKVVLTASEMDEVNNKAGDILGGKKTTKDKVVYTTLLQPNDGITNYGVGTALEYTQTIKETATASGSAELKNVVAGEIEGYKDVTVSFDKAIDPDHTEKNQIDKISGGNSVEDTKMQVGKLVAYGNSEYAETVTKKTITSVGTVTLSNVYVDDDVENFLTATITDSEINDDLEGGNIIEEVKISDVDGGDSSTATVKTVTAAGTATVTASKVNGNIEQFKDVLLAGGVEVGGDIIVGGDDEETIMRSNKGYENTPCYAVFYYNDGDPKVVYLTEAEYKVFVQAETSAMIDMTVAVYREQEARTDAQLKQPGVVDVLKTFNAYTDDPVTDVGAGQQGRNTTTYIVKTAGNSVIIDDKGAKLGTYDALEGKYVSGKVQGYTTVSVFGDSSFAAGYFGTAKNDKLELEANLATFTTQEAGKNPVGFDFGEGKDELVLTDATIGIQAAFKFNPVEGTNAWNLETISGSGTIVCRTEDVEDVKTAFEGIKVVGSDNYNAVNALKHQEYDDALNVDDTDDIADWLGFCNKSDYFQNGTGVEKTLSFEGDSVKSGDIVAQISVDGGATYQTLKNGDAVVADAIVKISQLASSTKASNDYTIAFK